MTEERWLDIPGWEGVYRVSDHGRVYSVKRPDVSRSGRALAQQPASSGHLSVSLRRDGFRRQMPVHQLVLAAFSGPRPAGMEVRHLDGDPQNNTLENLAYGTRSENVRDRVRHGTHWNTRKTHCPKGHPYDAENTRVVPSRPTTRYCRACSNARKAKS